jgi:hypothetical protein
MEISFGSEAHWIAVLMMHPFSFSPALAVRR